MRIEVIPGLILETAQIVVTVYAQSYSTTQLSGTSTLFGLPIYGKISPYRTFCTKMYLVETTFNSVGNTSTNIIIQYNDDFFSVNATIADFSLNCQTYFVSQIELYHLLFFFFVLKLILRF